MEKFYKFPCGCQFPIIAERDGKMPLIKFDVRECNYRCAAVWEMLGKGLTKGVFQLESHLGRQWCKRLKPTSLEHLSALGALLRPGAMNCISGDTKIGVKRNDRIGRKLNCKTWPMRIMYERFKRNHQNYENSIVSYNFEEGIFFNNRIINIFDNGIQPVYKPKFKIRKKYYSNSTFYSIASTLEHKYYSHDRGWVPLNDLFAGEKVLLRTWLKDPPPETIHPTWCKSFRDICYYCYRYNCIFCDWHEGSLDVNHLEGNRRTDNRPENLCFMCPNHHRIYSEGNLTKEQCVIAREKYVLKDYPETVWGEYLEIDYAGDIDTYDIEVEGPHHNYLAGNVIVHNCHDERGISATERYCRRKNNEEQVESIHPIIDDVLKPTYGIWCYQEQIMEIAKRVAGFDLVGVDELRKAVGVKDQAKLAKVGDKFAAGIEKTAVVDKELGTKLWEDIKTSGRYLFNKSHSHSYGINGYWSSVYKAHFPLYFFAAYLRNAFNEQKPFEEINELVNEAKLFDIEVKTPSVLNLKRHFDTDGEKIYFGLVDIKGVGETHFAKLKEAFKQGKPSTWYEFLVKHGTTVGVSTCDKLIKAGALDAISNVSRNQMLYELNKFEALSPAEVAWVSENFGKYTSLLTLMYGLAKPKKEGGGCSNKNRVAICLDIIKLLETPSQSLIDDPNWLVWNEKLLLGEAITCSKTDGCDTTASNCTCKEFLAGRGKSGRYKDFLTLAVTLNEVREMVIKKGEKKGQKFARLIVQDNSASLTDVMIWPEKYSEVSDLTFEGNVVLLIGSRNKKDAFEVESVSQL